MQEENNYGVNPESLVYQAYKRSKYLSIKWSTYFEVYDELFHKYRGKPIIFVEVGVLNGGSLFMWRDYFGNDARIIGVDFNPEAKKWEKDGFEIYIGDQSDFKFWENFYEKVGNIDILLDDGGHTNSQQIVTATSSVPKVRDGGLVVIEDVHSSYLREFGNPSKYSFINYAKIIVDDINRRSGLLKARVKSLGENVYSIRFYESIVVLYISRAKSIKSKQTSNNGLTEEAIDYRYININYILNINKILNKLLPHILLPFKRKISALVLKMISVKESSKIKKYFELD